MTAMPWEGEWAAERHQRRAAASAAGSPAHGSIVRLPDGIGGQEAGAYRRKYRSIMAVVASREIATRYPFAGAIAHLKAQKCPFGLLFRRRLGGRDGLLFRSAERYVAHSVSRGHGSHGGGGTWGRDGKGGHGGDRKRQMPRPHADEEYIEIDGVRYCGEAVTYALALMIAHMCGPRVAAKFAMGQAQWTVANMRADMGESDTKEAARFVQDYIWFLMPYDEAEGGAGAPACAGGTFSIGVNAYLRRSVHIADPAWKLVNRRVTDGRVVVGRDEMLRLARHDICSLIERDVAATRVDHAAGRAMEIYARNIVMDARIHDEAVRQATATAGTFGKPPCVTEAIASLGRAENLPHHGRLLVAAYMLRTGMSKDDVSALFRNAPDYSEATTRRQVEHIAGVGYMPQSCEKLESLGLCRRVPACGRIVNPVQFKLQQKTQAQQQQRRQGD